MYGDVLVALIELILDTGNVNGLKNLPLGRSDLEKVLRNSCNIWLLSAYRQINWCGGLMGKTKQKRLAISFVDDGRIKIKI